MDKLPYQIKQKIIKLNRLQQESLELQDELTDKFNSYGVDFNYFLSTADDSALEQTEAMSNILNGQVRNEDIEESISQIEEIFIKQFNVALKEDGR